LAAPLPPAPPVTPSSRRPRRRRGAQDAGRIPVIEGHRLADPATRERRQAAHDAVPSCPRRGAARLHRRRWQMRRLAYSTIHLSTGSIPASPPARWRAAGVRQGLRHGRLIPACVTTPGGERQGLDVAGSNPERQDGRRRAPRPRRGQGIDRGAIPAGIPGGVCYRKRSGRAVQVRFGTGNNGSRS